jgi:hypothetical protein
LPPLNRFAEFNSRAELLSGTSKSLKVFSLSANKGWDDFNRLIPMFNQSGCFINGVFLPGQPVQRMDRQGMNRFNPRVKRIKKEFLEVH